MVIEVRMVVTSWGTDGKLYKGAAGYIHMKNSLCHSFIIRMLYYMYVVL